jgi:poly-gamma-glutamate synthesis protein (capsule biosynthesis protein)
MGVLALLAVFAVGAVSAQEISSSTARPEVTLSAVGDIRLNGPVGDIIRAHGAQAPVAAIKDLLSADIVFGNLETSVTKRGTKTPKTWNFRSPPQNLKALDEGGFTMVNLANNHVWDYGEVGFRDTLSAVKKAGFLYIGGGKNLAEVSKPNIVEINGIKVGFLGFTSTFPMEAWARKNKPGVNYSDFDKFPAVIAAAKRECDVLVVSFHGGTELAEEPNQIQKDFMHLAVTAGADLILGHHPHVLQAVEVYKDKPILYSLGNFLFVSPAPATRPTVIAKITLNAQGVSRIDFVPVDTNWGTPKPVSGEEAKAVFQALDRQGALTQFPQRFKVLSSGS